MALRKKTRKKANPTTKYAEQVTSYMMEELGIESLDVIREVCELTIRAIELQTGGDEEEEEEPTIRKSTRRSRTSSKRTKKSSEPDEMQLGRVSLWENNGTGNFEFNGNIQFRWDGGRIKSGRDVDVEVSILLFEPDEDSKYLYSGILTEKVEGKRGRRKERSPIVGRVYVYDPGSAGRKKGMEAFAYLYLIDPDDEGDNVDPDYLYDLMPEELVPEEGAFAKLLIYENESDNENAPLFTGKVVLPSELEADTEEDEVEEEEEEEEPVRKRRGTRKNARSSKRRTSRDKGEVTTRSGRRRKGRSTRKSSTKSALDFSGAADMPDLYADDDDE